MSRAYELPPPPAPRPKIEVGDRYLITTREWFFAPDGRQYRAVFGTVRALRSDAETLGISTNRNSTNWYAEVGCLTVAGCQIHYAARTDTCNTADVHDEKVLESGEVVKILSRSQIFDADQAEAS